MVTNSCPDDEEIQYMDIKEFREAGYLQEVNRQFFHPLGLALVVEIDDDGNESLQGIQDWRKDPDGVSFYNLDLKPKAVHIQNEWNQRANPRIDLLGYMIQPVNQEAWDYDYE